MKLKLLRIENFKGIADLHIQIDGSLRVYGDNATGKSSLKDAFLWLLFDKDSQNRSDFAIKPRASDGSERHNLVTLVEATLDGLTLRKEQSEKWTKKRGSADRVFEGNETAYFIDGVPVKRKDYLVKIGEIADEVTFRTLTDTSYFCETMHHTERRKMLAKMTGVDMGNVATLEQDKARVAASIRDMKKDMDALPVRIDEANKALPAEEKDRATVEADIAAETAELKAVNERLAAVENGGAMVELKAQERKIQEERAELVRLDKAAEDKIADEKRRRVAEAQKVLDAAADKLSVARREYSVAEDIVSGGTVKLERLRKTYEDIAAQCFTGSTVCVACGQSLPGDKIDALKASWNTAHASEMNRAEAEGIAYRKTYDAAVEQVASLKQTLETAQASMKQAQELLAAAKAAPVVAACNPRIAELDIEIHKAGAGILDASRASADMVKSIKDEASAIESTLKALRQDIATIDAAEKTRERIKKLEAEQQGLSEKYATLERELMRIEDEQRAVTREVEEKVNSRFKSVRFQLFRERINGSLEECCDPMIGGVPYPSANNGARINAGLEIIATIGAHIGLSLPVFIDNAESVTRVYDAPFQTIELIVSEKDKTLRIEEKH